MGFRFDRSAGVARVAQAALAALALAPPAVGQTAPGRCAPNVPPPPSLPPVTEGQICATIAVLADDSLEGRRVPGP